MIISVVDNKTSENEFLKVPKIIYKNDPFWISPLNTDIKAKFNKKTNPHFRDGDAKRWILKDDYGNLIGRIAAFYSNKKLKAEKIPAGGVGFFECINDPTAATMLFDTAVNWLKKKDIKAMDAPVNFGENDSNWGLLAEGFMQQSFGMPYNYPYYKELFENYGFQVYFKQYTYHLDLTKKFPERFWKIADWISKKPDFTFRHFNFQESEKFINDMVQVYNVTWSSFKENFTPLNPEEIRATFKKARPIIDPDMIWFAYHNNEPIAFFIMFPDINQILKHFKGNINSLGKIKFLFLKNRKVINRIRAQVAGVVPKFQNSGIESGIFWHMNEKMKHKPWYKEIELSWVGDFNKKMIALYEAIGAKKEKTHITYRYMIDKKIPFERYQNEVEPSLKGKNKIQPVS